MPIFAAIVAFLARFAGMAFLQVLLTRALLVIGVSTVSYLGLSTVLSAAISGIQGNFGSLTDGMLAIVSLAKLDKAISIVLSAVSVRLVLAGLNGAGVLKKMLFRGP